MSRWNSNEEQRRLVIQDINRAMRARIRSYMIAARNPVRFDGGAKSEDERARDNLALHLALEFASLATGTPAGVISHEIGKELDETTARLQQQCFKEEEVIGGAILRKAAAR